MRTRAIAPWTATGLLLLVLGLGLGGTPGRAYDIPHAPTTYVTDEAHVLDDATQAALNQQLDQFERDTSNQIVVYIAPSLPPDAEVAQYCTQLYNAWQLGQKGPSLGQHGGNNGAVLGIFIQDRKAFIATGRGLEGALPDATCAEIVRNVLAPAFRQNNYGGGVQAAVNAMIAATKGEYKGTGTTQADQSNDTSNLVPIIIFIIIVIFIIVRSFGSGGFGGPMIFTGGGWGGGGYSGGDFGGGGGGGFSGGGGSSAGGGGGGSW